MEIKINKEIRGYTESVFFGLSARQSAFTAAGILLAGICYFLLREKLGNEGVSWVCILCAAPCIFFGFFRYNGMSAEKFIAAYIKCRVLEKKKIPFECTTLYYPSEKRRKETPGKERIRSYYAKDNEKSEKKKRTW